ncbi:hypothetical protein [Streptomyces iconiensis]|uniref:DUF748 domain-containing protein n=1 Tax=Streptomyces iconiensis TaxID=1384038 RepID=A0ABT7A967_9ACTN|nr:hypothetical protein [Streptomyces iconiensis]MDJ1137897.1 hypothetical protein [Streptomyces iconiensis]
MNTATKIATFGAALAATFGVAFGVGTGVGPLDAEPESGKGGHGAHAGSDGGKGSDGGSGGAAASQPGGLATTEGGYALDLKTPRVEEGRSEELRFVVRDSRGKAVTAYKTEHDKEMHLIVASRDLSTFRHLHPERAADGTWSTEAELPRAGDYRVFADFTPRAKGAEGLTLGADLAVGGEYGPQPLPGPSAKATVDGYDVRLDGTLRPGKAGELKLKVSKDGKPVTDLQPYLAAYGHLVALRSGDLAYLHVHPNGEPGDGKTKAGPGISFSATAPSAGSYRLFLDFKHEGKVRTAAFTVRTGGDGAALAGEEKGEKGDGHGKGSQKGEQSGEHTH